MLNFLVGIFYMGRFIEELYLKRKISLLIKILKITMYSYDLLKNFQMHYIKLKLVKIIFL
ncbi:hypothetical protein A0H76_471 [Hepatospora eriocheir]|uniref:Uncharacterized protein n=1 Tax=Hepatospora eriocheir TaxID=1081669 RepID=A0A1X0Q9A6_9MICR|nr:hypothetical protein A0H76_471 [Hepatospora eriocheir]